MKAPVLDEKMKLSGRDLPVEHDGSRAFEIAASAPQGEIKMQIEMPQ